jgi:hypothetical protein
MRLEDCTLGRRVQIGGRFLLTELNSLATIVDTRPAPANPEDNPAYPHGMVQVRLADRVSWPVREPWLGPEDLGFAPDAQER